MLSASLAAHADTLLFTLDGYSFTLPSSPTPSSSDANSFHIQNVAVTDDGTTSLDEIAFGVFGASSEYVITTIGTVVLGNGYVTTS